MAEFWLKCTKAGEDFGNIPVGGNDAPASWIFHDCAYAVYDHYMVDIDYTREDYEEQSDRAITPYRTFEQKACAVAFDLKDAPYHCVGLAEVGADTWRLEKIKFTNYGEELPT